MTTLAFKDDHDGYYQIDHQDGDPLPEWVLSLTPCDVIPAPTPVVPEPVPEVLVVSAFQARAALYQMGMLDSVETFMAYPATDPIAKLAWERAQEFKRDSPTILAVAPAMGLSDTQLDDIFRFAATIEA